MHTKRWLIPPILTPEADSALVAFPPVLRQVLFNRGYATDAEARAFLKAEPNFETDPFQMTGMRTPLWSASTARSSRRNRSPSMATTTWTA
jgi:hypothetical protein